MRTPRCLDSTYHERLDELRRAAADRRRRFVAMEDAGVFLVENAPSNRPPSDRPDHAEIEGRDWSSPALRRATQADRRRGRRAVLATSFLAALALMGLLSWLLVDAATLP